MGLLFLLFMTAGLGSVVALVFLFFRNLQLKQQCDELLQEKDVIYGFVHDVAEVFADAVTVEVDLMLKRVLAPLTQMADITRKIASGDYSSRVPLGPQDEAGKLGEAFNRMAESLQAIESLRKTLMINVAQESNFTMAPGPNDKETFELMLVLPLNVYSPAATCNTSPSPVAAMPLCRLVKASSGVLPVLFPVALLST